MTAMKRKLGIRERSCGLQSPPSVNHSGGVGFMSASAHGNTASDWSVSPQSPPHASEISVVHGVCTT